MHAAASDFQSRAHEVVGRGRTISPMPTVADRWRAARAGVADRVGVSARVSERLGPITRRDDCLRNACRGPARLASVLRFHRGREGCEVWVHLEARILALPSRAFARRLGGEGRRNAARPGRLRIPSEQALSGEHLAPNRKELASKNNHAARSSTI